MNERENGAEHGPSGGEEPGRDGPGQEPSGGSLVDLYERMSRAVRDNLERAGTITEDTLDWAVRESREWTRHMREYYAEDIQRVSEFVRRDWQEAARQAREQTRRSLDFDRLHVGMLGFLSRLAQSAGSQLESFASRLNERLTYRTGEIAGAGTLECAACGQHLVFEKTRRIPPCPRCHQTIFRRSF